MVSENYLYKVRFAVRTVSTDSNVLQELTDIIEECRAHMVTVAGVKKDVAEDETNPLVLGCVRSLPAQNSAMTRMRKRPTWQTTVCRWTSSGRR